MALDEFCLGGFSTALCAILSEQLVFSAFKVQSSICGNARVLFQAADVKTGFFVLSYHEESRQTVALPTQVNTGLLYLETLKG